MSNPSTSDRLSFTVFIAIAFHAAVILGISYTKSKSDKVAPTLNITLATHASAKSPEKADFLAQHNQQASGTEDSVKELTTTELAKVADIAVNKVNPIPVQQSEVIFSDKKEVLTTVKSEQVIASDSQDDDKQLQQGQDRENNEVNPTQKLASLQAKLDRQRQALAREPRITRHTSVSTKSSEEAAYYNSWSQKIVRVGNLNYPKEALQKEIFGDLRLSVKIRADGTVANIQILESSGHSLLDNAALQIVKLSSPFDPFPPEIEKQTDIFEIIRTWKFEISGLSTSAD